MTRPLPNNIQVNQWGQSWSQNDLGSYVSPEIAETIFNIWTTFQGWIEAYLLLILILVFFIGAVHAGFKYLKRKERNIEKLWNFLLFFLSKRQMMIPLLCTLGSREDVLSAQKKKRLIDLRNMSREHPLQDNPEKRIALEEEISQMLFSLFNTLEREGKLNHKNPLFHIMQDLEYIDEKLVELQSIYNKEAQDWNKTWGNGTLSIIGCKPFAPFGE